jgi:hypothetical protein
MTVATHLGRRRPRHLAVWSVALLTIFCIGCGSGGGESTTTVDPGSTAVGMNAPVDETPVPDPVGPSGDGGGGGGGGGDEGHAPEIDPKSAAAALLLLGCATLMVVDRRRRSYPSSCA